MLVCVSVSVQTLRMTVADSSSCGWTSSLPACVNIIITMFLDIFVVILRSLLTGTAVLSHHFFCVSG